MDSHTLHHHPNDLVRYIVLIILQTFFYLYYDILLLLAYFTLQTIFEYSKLKVVNKSKQI